MTTHTPNKSSVPHKAGFVSIIGNPNVGKSTLMNTLVGQNLSIITPKVQTTRSRITGILNGPHFQIVFSDTPGLINPKYSLQEAMMKQVRQSLIDVDAILWVVDPFHSFQTDLTQKLDLRSDLLFIVLNKSDLISKKEAKEMLNHWKSLFPQATCVSISARTGKGIFSLLKLIIKRLPEHPNYYAKDSLTDLPERFFAAEIIREQIFKYYRKEIPYSSEVRIDTFQDEASLLRLHALIYVERDSQKGILIGKNGSALKRIGIFSRKKLEKFFNKHVFLEMKVRVAPQWRHQNSALKQFGYIH